MASKRAAVPAKHLFTGFSTYQAATRSFVRGMATVNTSSEAGPPLQEPPATSSANIASTHESVSNIKTAPAETLLRRTGSAPSSTTSSATPKTLVTTRNKGYTPPPNPFRQSVTCTLYSFPSLEPVSLAQYPDTHLLLPLRKDILHRAVIYEADNSRRGTASTKWRSEVHGSNRKVRPQKGSGRARLGDKKSPMLKGGGVAFGPKPRDFSTDLPKKVYDLAWRTALSYRYRKGELIVTDGEIDVAGVHENSLNRYLADVLRWNGWGNFGRGSEEETSENNGSTTFLTAERREGLFSALESREMRHHGQAEEVALVDVKNLLEGARLVVERQALEAIFWQHQSDLPMAQKWTWNTSKRKSALETQNLQSPEACPLTPRGSYEVEAKV